MADVVPSTRGYLNAPEGSDGSTAQWIAFAFVGAAMIASGFLAYVRNVKPSARLFYYLVTAINAITALSYLIQALDSGVQWVRYAQWALTGPLTMVTFGLLAGASWVDIFFTVIATLLGVAAGFAGALSLGENAAWPLLGFAAACFFVVAISLLYTFRTAAYKVHGEIGKLYDVLAFSSTALYAGYVIMWGTAEGSHNATPDQSIIVYAVFDILAAAVGGLFLLLSRESIARYGSFLGSNSAEYDFSFATASATANIKA